MSSSPIDTQYPPYVLEFITPINFFGEEAAEAEWEDPERSAQMFLHTQSYEQFKRDDILYLFGRRGTGKTALMRMLDYEINHERATGLTYTCSARVDEEEAYHDLSSSLRGSPLADYPADELVYFLIKKWKWIINITAMVATVKKYDSVHTGDELITIKKYLIKNQLMSNGVHSPVKKVVNAISNALVNIEYESAKLGLAIFKIGEALFEKDYEDAYNCLIKFLQKNKFYALVFVDSIHMYNKSDTISRSVVTALIESVRQTYNEKSTKRILAKAAFPSEIYPRIEPWNKDKIERKNLFIFWRYRDLVSLLAKRHLNKFGSANSNNICNSLDEYISCKDYLYQFLPENIITGQGIEFDTIAYIIRHTQKKPREVIALLNIIYTLVDAGKHDNFSIPKDSIVDGVHARLDIIVDGALDIFNQVFDGCSEIVRRTLNRVPDIFNPNELDAFINEVSSLRSIYNHTTDDIKRMLLETGSIGIKKSSHSFPQKNKEFIEAIFEYQVKGTLDISPRTTLTVHPLLYQSLHINVNYDSFVYPMPYEGEEQEMLEGIGISVL